MANPTVTLKASNGVELSVLLGDTSPVLSDGVSTWETDARPKRRSITRFTGYLPFKQDIVVLFDGWMTKESQENRIQKLIKLSSQPHTIKLSGQALKTELKWVIDGVDWDTTNTIWNRTAAGAVRLRQQATIHLLEWIVDDVIETPVKLSIAKKQVKDPAKKVTVKTGMTIKQIASMELGDADKWRMICNANPSLPDNPRALIKAGTIIIIPASAWDALHGINPIFIVP